MCVASRTRKEKRKGGGDVAEVGSVEPVAAGQCHGGGGASCLMRSAVVSNSRTLVARGWVAHPYNYPAGGARTGVQQSHIH